MNPANFTEIWHDLRRRVNSSGLLLAACLVLSGCSPSESEPPPAKPSSVLEASPVCPWRDPLADLARLFPPATNYVLETRILSEHTAELRRHLGRQMTPDENPLRIHRVRHGDQTTDSVLVTRIKAEHGGLELVTGIASNGLVRGVLIQSQREPEAVARVITSSNFLAAFAGKNAAAAWRIGLDLPEVPPEARLSAQAIADGVRSQLIVLFFASSPPAAPGPNNRTGH